MAKKKSIKAAAVRQGRRDDGNAFVRDPESGPARVQDDLAEMVAEAYLESATSGEERGEDMLNEFVVEELGGPFVDDEPLMDDLPTEPGTEPS